MKLYWRLLLLFFTYRKKPVVPALGPCRTGFWVVPTDLDLLMHMNNGVYLTLMDIGRMDLMLRSGLYSKLKPLGWYPVITGSTMRFKRSLKLFQRFDIVTEVIGWDEKAVLLGQSFYRGEELVAEGVVVSRFLKRKGGSVSTKELMDAIGHADASPVLPEWVEHWHHAQIKSNDKDKVN